WGTIPTPSRAYSRALRCGPGTGSSNGRRPYSYGILAVQIGARGLGLGRSGEKRRARGMERRAQLRGAQQYAGHEKGRAGFFLPFGEGKGGGRNRAGGQ